MFAAKSRRQYMTGDQLLLDISNILLELNDPRLNGLTITKVDMSKNLRAAKVLFITPMSRGNDIEIKASIKGLNSAKGYIRRKIAKISHLRCVPEIYYAYDSDLTNSIHISTILNGE